MKWVFPLLSLVTTMLTDKESEMQAFSAFRVLIPSPVTVPKLYIINIEEANIFTENYDIGKYIWESTGYTIPADSKF